MTHALALLVALALPHAPAPKARPAIPPAAVSPVGEWVLERNGGSGPCVFAADGSFSCIWAGQQWLGLWEMAEAAEGRTLTVSEWIPAKDELTPASAHVRWSAALRLGTLAGPLDGAGAGGMFRLRKAEAGKGKKREGR
jgi:hypothetical protein